MDLIDVDIAVPDSKLAEISALLDGVEKDVQRVGVRAVNKVGVATDNLILAHDFATYGANTNVGQDTHAAPGSMALCGVGY